MEEIADTVRTAQGRNRDNQQPFICIRPRLSTLDAGALNRERLLRIAFLYVECVGLHRTPTSGWRSALCPRSLAANLFNPRHFAGLCATTVS